MLYVDYFFPENFTLFLDLTELYKVLIMITNVMFNFYDYHWNFLVEM